MKIEMEIADERIMDLLCAAFESGNYGVGYWCKIKKYVKRNGAVPTVKNWCGGDATPYEHVWLPLANGCGLLLTEDCNERGCEVKDHLLDRAACERGLKVMAEKYPNHYGDFVGENDDAETGDVFVQCCLFGELKYG